MNNQKNSWETSNSEIFWGEIAPCDHLVQIYEDDTEILNALEGFIEGGFKLKDSVIIIATDFHLKSLHQKLTNKNYDLISLQADNLYIPLNVDNMLSQFMETGWPNETLFTKTINDLLVKARGTSNRNIRAYGEMVAILWAQGYNGATVQLEYLWNKFCSTEAFCLFCAYPKSGFTQDIDKSINHICSMHTKIISGEKKSSTEIFHRSA